MSIEIRDSIHSDIVSQFPAVYQENSPFLLQFIEAYYEYLDDKLERDLPRLKDIDTTLTSFIVFYKRKYLADLPFSPETDVRFVLKHIQDLYTRKGSEESLQLLFKVFFNEDIEVFYPGNNVLKASDSIYRKDVFLEMKPIYYGALETYPISRGNTIRGDLSQANAFVDDIVFVNLGGSITPIVYLSSQQGSFVQSDSLEVLAATAEGSETVTNVGKLINGSISEVKIQKAGRLQSNRVGDTVDLISNIVGTGCKGVISEVDTEQVGSIDYEIEDGGWGYIDPSSVTIEYFNEIGISNRVIVVDRGTVLDVEVGDTIIFPGSTIDYDSRGETDILSLSGSARIIAYRHPLLFIESKTDQQEMYEFMSRYYDTGTTGPNGRVYRNVLYDQHYNAYYYAIQGVGEFNPNNALFFPPKQYDEIYSKLYYKPNEADGDQSIIGNFTGALGDGDLSNLSEIQIVNDFQLFYRFIMSANNGIDDQAFTGATDNDIEVLNYLASTSEKGIVDINALAQDRSDRTPTVSALNPAGAQSPQAPMRHLIKKFGDLKHGQLYTILNTGSVLSEADYIAMGAKNGKLGTDFIYNEFGIDQISVVDGGVFNYGLFDIGEKYKITSIGQGYDWTSVGATETAKEGDIFVASNAGTDTYTDTVTLTNVAIEFDGYITHDAAPIKVGDKITVSGTDGNSHMPPDYTSPTEYIVTEIDSTDEAGLALKTRLQKPNGNVFNRSGDTGPTSGLTFLASSVNYGGQARKLLIDNLSHDAIFSVHKQVYARLFQYLSQVNVNGQRISPKLTVGKTMSAPPEGQGYDWYNTHFVPTDQLIPGELYRPFKIGELSYSEWIDIGLDLTDDSYDLTVDVLPVNSSTGEANSDVLNIRAKKKYIISDIGDLGQATWQSLGASEDAVVGDVFIASEDVSDITIPDLAVPFSHTNLTAGSANIDISNHGFKDGDKVIFTQTALIEIQTVPPSYLQNGGAFYVGVVSAGRFKLYTSRNRLQEEMITFASAAANSGSGVLYRQRDGAKVIDTSLMLEADVIFTASDPQPEDVSATGICVDTRKSSSSDTDDNYKTVVTHSDGNQFDEWLGYYSVDGTIVDPLKEGGIESNEVPADILFENGFNVMGFVNGDYRRPVECQRIGKYNDSSTFEIVDIDERETISLVPDIVGDVVAERFFASTNSIDDGNRFRDGVYDLSGVIGPETKDTEYRDAFSKVTFTLGRISEIRETEPGTAYENDVGVQVVNDAIARFNKRDVKLRFVNDDFNLVEGEVIEQERELQDTTIDQVDGLSIPQIEAMPASTTSGVSYKDSTTTFSIENERYIAKAKFIKRVDEDYFFRPISFNGFDRNVPIRIKAQDRIISQVNIDEDSLPMGANADISGSVKYDSGQINEVTITHTGYKFKDNEILSVINTNPNNELRYNDVVATARIRTLGQGNTTGEWKTRNSFVGEYGTRIHDNDYYQEYAYDISSMINPEVYTPIVKNVVGVAGTKMFSTSLINSENAVDPSIDVLVQKYSIVLQDYIAEGSGVVGDPTFDINVQSDIEDRVLTDEAGETFVAVTTSTNPNNTNLADE